MNHTSAKAQRPRMLVRSLVLVVDPSFNLALRHEARALLFARKSR
jgi:hypothetical protein